MSSRTGQGAEILPFPLQRTTSLRLNALDRAEARDWERAARVRGYAQVTIMQGDAIQEDAQENGAAADIALVYYRGELWTLSGIAGHGRRFGLWRHRDGVRIGEFPAVRDALDAIFELPQATLPGTRGEARQAVR
jgi:hypothetical protein